jgi:Mg-chelatase subunit ChlD
LKKTHTKKRVVTGNTKLKETEKINELAGKLRSDFSDKKLMHSVLQNDRETINEGKIIIDAINQGFSSLTPDILFEQLVKNFSLAKQIIGESLIRELSGYESAYIEKNLCFPEFRRELKKKVEEKIEKLKEMGLIKEELFTEKAFELASLVLCMEELDKLLVSGLGEKIHKKHYIYGSKEDVKPFRKGRYRDIAIKKSVKKAVRRNHKRFEKEDLMSFERKSSGKCFLVYALDASGSMKGSKIRNCKKAGIALAYKAIEGRDEVGLIVFGEKIKTISEPSQNFSSILKDITKIRAANETNIAATIQQAANMLKNKEATKHLILITDALPTAGKNPEKETVEAASSANAAGITISVIGIALNKTGESIGKKIAEIGQGRLYIVKDSEKIDRIVLEDYYSVA